jgi:hypothetical protein
MGETEDIHFTNTIRRIGGTKKNPEIGINVPPWVVRDTELEQGDKVKITIEKEGKEE